MTIEELKALTAHAQNYRDIYNTFCKLGKVEPDTDPMTHACWFEGGAVLHMWLDEECIVNFYFQSDWYHDNVEENPKYYEWNYEIDLIARAADRAH